MSRPFPGTGIKAIGVVLCAALTLLLFPSGCRSAAHLRVGTLPVMDALPLSLATHRPIFTENRLAVDITRYETPSRLRDALVNGDMDAIITDLAGAILLLEKQAGARVVRVAMRASPGRPMFALVAPLPYAVRDLEGDRIAVVNEPQDQYVASKLLETAGVSRWTAIDAASAEAGVEMVRRGEAAAALVPDNLIPDAATSGFHIIMDDRDLALGQTVVVFSEFMVNQKPAFIRRFLQSYEQAAREINVRPEQYLSLAAELVGIPPEMSGSLSIPVFPFPGEAPTESEVESVNTWLVKEKLLPHPIPYTDAVNVWFLWDPYQFHPASCCGW